MDSTKNFLDAWMSVQNQIADNFMDTSKKIQNSLQNNEVVGKTLELYQGWFEKQKTITDTVFSNLKGQGNEQQQVPSFVKDWLQTQLQMGQQWGSLLNNNNSTNTQSSPQDWLQNVSKWYQGLSQQFQGFSPQMPTQGFGQMPQTINDMIANSQNYLRMYEMWQGISKMTQSNTMGVENLGKMIDMGKYTEMLNGMFQFMTPEKSQNFLQMMQQYQGMMFSQMPQMREMMGKFNNPNASQGFDGLFNQGLGSLSSLQQNFSEQFHKFINPYFNMLPAGKEKDISAIMLKVQDNLAQYYVKASETQNMVYETGKKALEKVVRQVMEKAGKSVEVIQFDEFYTLWVDTMENDMIALFGSEGYSKLQGKMLQLGLDIKVNIDAQMEHILAPLPIVPRSEMDEVNATIHELKRKVRNLEKNINKENPEQSDSPATPTKRAKK